MKEQKKLNVYVNDGDNNKLNTALKNINQRSFKQIEAQKRIN